MNVTITRRSKVGFGYTSAVENDDRGNLVVCETTKPDYTGTILQVAKKIETDRTLASFCSGTYYSTAWFVKLNGKWHRVVGSDHNMFELGKLTEKYPSYQSGVDKMVYLADAVSIEIE